MFTVWKAVSKPIAESWVKELVSNFILIYTDVKHIIAYLYHKPETLDCQCMYFAFDILNRKLIAHTQQRLNCQ
jgi:hypothetical protein